MVKKVSNADIMIAPTAPNPSEKVVVEVELVPPTAPIVISLKDIDHDSMKDDDKKTGDDGNSAFLN